MHLDEKKWYLGILNSSDDYFLQLCDMVTLFSIIVSYIFYNLEDTLLNSSNYNSYLTLPHNKILIIYCAL